MLVYGKQKLCSVCLSFLQSYYGGIQSSDVGHSTQSNYQWKVMQHWYIAILYIVCVYPEIKCPVREKTFV